MLAKIVEQETYPTYYIVDDENEDEDWLWGERIGLDVEPEKLERWKKICHDFNEVQDEIEAAIDVLRSKDENKQEAKND